MESYKEMKALSDDELVRRQADVLRVLINGLETKGTKQKPALVTFTKWCLTPADRRPVSVNPDEVSDVEDYCGDIDPGSIITLKNKKTYFVQGVHADIVAKLKGEQS